MRAKPCKECGQSIAFVISVRSGKTVAVNAKPEGCYVETQPGRGDPDELRTEYRRVWRAHAETCTKKRASDGG
jgi:hypothetical protein